ncbi:MAG: SDR family oxidoreductase [Acidobacteriota bacterium]
MIDLRQRRVAVTGGSRGIGAACCRLFAGAGAAVLVAYGGRRGAAEELAEELRQINPGPHDTVGGDLASPAGAEALAQAARNLWGGLDCLVNNAGVWWRNPLGTFDVESYRRLMAVNVDGCFLAARAVLPLLERSSDGNIVNITSTAGQRGEADYSAYAASKGAMIAATKAWSTELAPRVRVNSVAPGWVDSEMCAPAFADGGRERIAASIPLGRVADPGDIAGPVVFLASSLARHITGEVLNVNGGSVLAG